MKPSGGRPGLVRVKPPFLLLEMTGVPVVERMRSLSRLLRSMGMCNRGLGLALWRLRLRSELKTILQPSMVQRCLIFKCTAL